MKKIYLPIIVMLLGISTYGQNILTEIDVDGGNSGNSPSITGNIANVSSQGFTRGPGAIYDNGTEYSVEGLNEPTNAAAISSGDFIQFSISGDANYLLDLTLLEIKLGRRNPQGPTKFRMYYSVDNFASTSIPLLNVDPSETDVEGASTIQTVGRKAYSYDLSVIENALGSTITFRMYIWGGDPSNSADSLIKIFSNTSSGNNPNGAPGKCCLERLHTQPWRGSKNKWNSQSRKQRI